jgi:transcriptional regulator with XRE-family HTH domain
MKKAPNDVDRQVGARVRMRRMMLGMSQEKLADGLGLTFQQVQKYEKGTNRISASRLQQISGLLGVSIDYLYGGGGGEAPAGFAEERAAGYEVDLVTSDGVKLLRALQGITDARVRRRLVDLAQALADMEVGTPERSP